jgi:glyoxylase-like metal-dependent hydrolase (beta-lactamase superfamily II)
MKVRRIRAPNPGLFTGTGTNTWVASSGESAVIVDPGPAIASHLNSIKATLTGLRPIAALVTHCHPDHSTAANDLAEELGVPVMAGCEGPGLRPDETLYDGQSIEVGDAVIDAIYTPGHTPDHFCFRTEASLFSGDHLIAGPTVITEHMADYLDSLHKVQGIGITRLLPGHGPIMRNAKEVIRRSIDHREERERQIVAAIEGGATWIGMIVEHVYADIDSAFYGMAARTVGAHLRKLADEGQVMLPRGSDDWIAPVQLVGPPTPGKGTRRKVVGD